MKAPKIREMGEDELASKVTELQDQIFRMRVKKATGQLDQAPKIRALRRDVARMKTILSERKRAASQAG